MVTQLRISRCSRQENEKLPVQFAALVFNMQKSPSLLIQGLGSGRMLVLVAICHFAGRQELLRTS